MLFFFLSISHANPDEILWFVRVFFLLAFDANVPLVAAHFFAYEKRARKNSYKSILGLYGCVVPEINFAVTLRVNTWHLIVGFVAFMEQQILQK